MLFWTFVNISSAHIKAWTSKPLLNLYFFNMSFTKAYFRVHSHFQKFISTPYIFDTNINCLVENPKYSKKSFRQILYCLAITLFSVFQLIYTMHLGNLFSSWQNDKTCLNLNQITFSAIWLTIVTLRMLQNSF